MARMDIIDHADEMMARHVLRRLRLKQRQAKKFPASYRMHRLCEQRQFRRQKRLAIKIFSTYVRLCLTDRS